MYQFPLYSNEEYFGTNNNRYTVNEAQEELFKKAKNVRKYCVASFSLNEEKGNDRVTISNSHETTYIGNILEFIGTDKKREPLGVIKKILYGFGVFMEIIRLLFSRSTD
jgi:hypothetical protein